MPRPRVPHKTIDGLVSKYCRKCDTWKPTKKFAICNKTWDKLNNSCRECSSNDYKARAELKKLEKRKLYKTKIFNWIKANWDAILEYAKICESDIDREHYIEDYKYRKEKRTKDNKALAEKRKTDTHFALHDRLRKRVLNAIKNNIKSAHTTELLGCSIDFCQGYLEAQFSEGMSWDNFGEWHIDHIVPCDYFDLSIEVNQYRCFNYKNLQPLWKLDNIRKGNRLTAKSKKLIPILEKITGKQSHISTPLIPRPKQPDSERDQKISSSLTQYNQTPTGKRTKPLSHQKRSETMRKQREEIRSNLTEKLCLKCSVTKPVSDYHKKSAAKDGLQAYCKACVNENKKHWRENRKTPSKKVSN